MLVAELTKLIARIQETKCEHQNIELKKAQKGTPKRLYDTFSSFANQSGGGVLIFGIDESADFAITGVPDVQTLQQEVTKQALQMEPAVRPVFTVAVIDGKTVVSAEVAECDNFEKPCYYKGLGKLHGSYIRVGDADLPMSEYEVYSYEAFRRQIQDELRDVERADYGSFDQTLLQAYFIAAKNSKPLLANQEEEKILRLQGMMQHEKPTVAGLILFGEYPQAFFPQLCITAVAVDGRELGTADNGDARFTDNRRLEGTIPRMLEDALSFVRRNTKSATIIDENGVRADRDEYPMLAVREIILNSLLHRDYSIHTQNAPIRVMLFRDRLEVENPGGLYGRITLDELGKSAADTRNPFLAGALEVLHITENRFSGIPTIKNEMQKAGLPPPVFINRRGTFTVILYNTPLIAETAAPATDDIPDSLSDLLAFCATPRSREEIATFMGIKTTFYVMEHYVQPLLQQGKLRMTIPEKPKSKRQRYVRK